MAKVMETPSNNQTFSRYDIRVIIKFSVLLGKDPPEIYDELSMVLGENAPSIQTVRKWVKAVAEGRDDMEDESRPRRPVTACGDANVSKVLDSLKEDRRKTCEEIAMDAAMSSTSVFRVLTENWTRKRCFPNGFHIFSLRSKRPHGWSFREVSCGDLKPSSMTFWTK